MAESISIFFCGFFATVYAYYDIKSISESFLSKVPQQFRNLWVCLFSKTHKSSNKTNIINFFLAKIFQKKKFFLKILNFFKKFFPCFHEGEAFIWEIRVNFYYWNWFCFFFEINLKNLFFQNNLYEFFFMLL